MYTSSFEKRRHVVLLPRLVCRPSDVCSISFDPFAWKLPKLVQWMFIESRCSLLIFRPQGQRSRIKLLVFDKTAGLWKNVGCSISPEPYAGKLLNTAQWMPLESRWPILMSRSWSKVKVKLLVFETNLSAQYLLTSLLESCQTWYCECLMIPTDVQFTWSKVMVKLLVFEQMLSAQYLTSPLLVCQTSDSGCH